uniref:Uncharacterized protein n=1 Tax=Peronospora matthiolae TaxID=2874970 RepID=A0AAV1TP58_9STRA
MLPQEPPASPLAPTQVVNNQTGTTASLIRKKRSKFRSKTRQSDGQDRSFSLDHVPCALPSVSMQQKRDTHHSSVCITDSIHSSCTDSMDRDSCSHSDESSESVAIPRRPGRPHPNRGALRCKTPNRKTLYHHAPDASSLASVQPGRFRYLKPEEIQSGQVADYDFAVIVNRVVQLPNCVTRAMDCFGCCCCGAPAVETTVGGPRSNRGCLDSIADASHERSGFRRLCRASSQHLSESEDEHRRIVTELCSQGLEVDIIDGGDSKGRCIQGTSFCWFGHQIQWSCRW